MWVYIHNITTWADFFERLMKVTLTLLIKRLQRPYLENKCTANKHQK